MNSRTAITAAHCLNDLFDHPGDFHLLGTDHRRHRGVSLRASAVVFAAFAPMLRARAEDGPEKVPHFAAKPAHP